MSMRQKSDAVDRPEEAAISRSGERTHLFLDATLALGASSVRVRVRNLSPTGALVEGPMKPSIGETVTLHRGSLAVAGRTKWVAPGRCGIQFDAPLVVADWMPVKSASRHSLEASVTGSPPAPVILPFDPAIVTLDRKLTVLGATPDHPAEAAESHASPIAQAIEELVSLQSDMLAKHQELGLRGVDNQAELEALVIVRERIGGIATTLRNVYGAIIIGR